VSLAGRQRAVPESGGHVVAPPPHHSATLPPSSLEPVY
jgi:hypothetical protein